DTFKFQALPNIASLSVDGGADSDTVDLSTVATNMQVSLEVSGSNLVAKVYEPNKTFATSAANKKFTATAVEKVIAGTGGDNTLDLSALASDLLIRIIGQNKVEIAKNTATSGNPVWQTIFNAENVQNVIGGTGKNYFVVAKGGSLAGTIDGKGAAGNVLS